MLAVTDPNIIKALEAEKYFIGSNEYREYYEEREKAIRDYNSFLSSAKREGLRAGMTIGMERGMERGMEHGLKQGMERGRAEIIIKMLNRDKSVAEIADLTGATVSEIKAIAEKYCK